MCLTFEEEITNRQTVTLNFQTSQGSVTV